MYFSHFRRTDRSQCCIFKKHEESLSRWKEEWEWRVNEWNMQLMKKKKKKMLKRFRIDRNLSRQRRFEIIPRAFSDYRGSKSLLFALLTDWKIRIKFLINFSLHSKIKYFQIHLLEISLPSKTLKNSKRIATRIFISSFETSH